MRYRYILYLLSSFLPIVSIEGYAAETIEQKETCKTNYSQSLTITPAIYPYLVEPKDYPEYYGLIPRYRGKILAIRPSL